MYLHQFMNVFRCRKSVKSLFFLLPLLGITNVLHFVWPNPLRGSWLSFAVWSITSHFLYSFQGVFVASVYFLFDDKVRKNTKLKKNRCNWFISNFSFCLLFLTFQASPWLHHKRHWFFFLLLKVKDTLYKFWVLKVRLRDWGFSNSVNNPSRPGSIRATNCRVFEPSNLDSERSKSQIITLAFLKSLIFIQVPMGSLRVNTSNFDIHSTQSSFKRTPVSTQNSLKKPQLRKVKIPSVKENSQSKCKTSKVVGLYISWI